MWAGCLSRLSDRRVFWYSSPAHKQANKHNTDILMVCSELSHELYLSYRHMNYIWAIDTYPESHGLPQTWQKWQAYTHSNKIYRLRTMSWQQRLKCCIYILHMKSSNARPAITVLGKADQWGITHYTSSQNRFLYQYNHHLTTYLLSAGMWNISNVWNAF